MVCFDLDATLAGHRVSDSLLDTESTTTLTIQSFVTVVAGPPTTSASATSSNGLGDYIMQGLSDSPVSSSAQVLPGPVTAPFPSKNATTAAGWEACQISQISWSDAWTSAYQPEVVTRTYTNTNNQQTVTFNVTLGDSDVYTTIDGIPHAHGEIEPTATSQFVEFVRRFSNLHRSLLICLGFIPRFRSGIPLIRLQSALRSRTLRPSAR